MRRLIAATVVFAAATAVALWVALRVWCVDLCGNDATCRFITCGRRASYGIVAAGGVAVVTLLLYRWLQDEHDGT